MEDATVGTLFIEILKTGASGFLFGAIVKAIGRKEFVALIMIVTMILCAIMAYQMVNLMIKATVDFFEPMINFFDAFAKKKQTLDNAIEPMREIIENFQEGGNKDG